jgi:hypothetical protein
MPTIRIDDDVYEGLQALAEPFVDTPNTVIRRLLEASGTVDRKRIAFINGDGPAIQRLPEDDGTMVYCAPGEDPQPMKRATSATKRKPKAKRASSGDLLPESSYEMPLMAALYVRGGSAPARDVIEIVGEALKNDLTPTDKQRLKSGGIRWQNRVQFVRLRLIERGWIRKDTERGVWALSEDGMKVTKEVIDKLEAGAD